MTSVPSTVGIVASGEDVLNDAVFWVDAGRSSVVSGALSNLGTGGSTLNAVFGNSTGVDSFDPALLAHTGTNYLYLPGVSGNSSSAPSITAYNINGDLEIELDIALVTLSPTTNSYILARGVGDPNRAFFLSLQSTGAPRLSWYPTGSAASAVNAISTATLASVGISAGQRFGLKVTLDVDNGASGNDVRFWYSTNNGSSWTQLGSTITNSGVTSLPTVTASMNINPNLGGTELAASVYRCIVRNGIGGTTVFDADFTTGITSGSQTTFTESSANAATVTINRSTSGRKAVAVTRPILLFGTDDYLEVADNDMLDFGASDSFTVLLVHRAWATFATSAAGVAKKANATATTQGWLLSAGSTTAAQGQMQVGDGTNGTTAVSGSRTSGALSIVTAVRNVTADTVQTFLGNTGGTAITDATTTTSANAEVMRIGRLSGAGTGYSDFEVLAAAVWRRALNANEIATIVARYS